MSVNKVILIGRLVRDPEVRYGEKSSVCRFTLAVDRPKIAGQKQAETDFINCIAFGKTGDAIGNYVYKGHRLYVEGALRTGSYTNKQGQKVYTTDVHVSAFEFLEGKKNTDSTNQSSFDKMGGTIGDDMDLDF